MLTNKERFEIEQRRQKEVAARREKSLLKAFWSWLITVW
jgi:hypothetical protein